MKTTTYDRKRSAVYDKYSRGQSLYSVLKKLNEGYYTGILNVMTEEEIAKHWLMLVDRDNEMEGEDV